MKESLIQDVIIQWLLDYDQCHSLTMWQLVGHQIDICNIPWRNDDLVTTKLLKLRLNMDVRSKSR